jgi:hypothetical protein
LFVCSWGNHFSFFNFLEAFLLRKEERKAIRREKTKIYY